jgi:PAS domain S-box-containing protein
MATAERSPEELLSENENLRFRLEEAEETLRAIGNGEVDAFVVSGSEGEQVFTLKGAEQPYRVLVETMNEGAATLGADGTILYCNNRLAAMLHVPMEKLVGTQLGSYVSPTHQDLFTARLGNCSKECDKDEIAMTTSTGKSVPVLISCCALDLSERQGISIVVTDLSQQKRNEEIFASEKLTRLIIEQAGEAIIVCDDGGRIIQASRLAHELCGENPILKSFDEIFKMRILDLECFFSVKIPLHGERFESAEVDFKRNDDRIFYLILNATPLKNEQNHCIGCVVTLTDITERKRSEEELRVAYVRISDILEQMSDGFASFDHDWRYTHINSAAAKAFHVAPEQLLGKTIWEMWPGAHDLPVGVNFRRSVKENISIQFETYYPAPLDRWFECRCHPTSDGLATFLSDITERKQAEETIVRQAAELDTLYATAPIGLFFFDADLRFVRVNHAMAELNGLPVEQHIGRTLRELLTPELANEVEPLLRSVMQTGRPLLDMEVHGATAPRPQDQRDWLVSYYPVQGENGTIRGVHGVIQEITERKRIEEELQQAHDDLERRVGERTEELALSIRSLQDEIMERARVEKSLSVETAERLLALEALREKEQMLIQQSRLAAMGEMIGNIAHQWRQPLNLLGLTTQQLLMFYDMGGFDRKFLAENVENSMKLIFHMSQTIDDFRNFFKPDKEKAKFKVREAVTNTLTLLEGSLQSPRISVEIVALEDPVINGYANEFAQVVLNIIINAKDVFTEREINDAKLSITVASENDCAVVTVADNAGGIPDDVIDKVFDPYFTTKGPQGGTGVGLFMSKTIIEKNMGGRLSVRNTANGAEFRIEVCNGTGA